MAELLAISVSGISIILSIILVHQKSHKERQQFQIALQQANNHLERKVDKLHLHIALIANHLEIKLPNGDRP